MSVCAIELADLYRMATTVSVDEFPAHVLTRLQQWIHFDGAVFGFGTPEAQRVQIASASVHGRDPLILDDYAPLSHSDPVTAAFLQRPPVPLQIDTRTHYAAPTLHEHARFARHHDLRHLMLFGDSPQVQGPWRWIVLYRGTDRGFDAEPAQCLLAAWPHITCALELNRAQALHREEAHRPLRALALVDRCGMFEALDPAFHALICQEWPQADSSRLPPPALAALDRDERLLGRKIELGFRRLGQHVLCRARSRESLSCLSPREQQVAECFAAGHSHKEVARLLQISPHTVRAQLAQVYRKLGVDDKAALANRLSGVPPR